MSHIAGGVEREKDNSVTDHIFQAGIGTATTRRKLSGCILNYSHYFGIYKKPNFLCVKSLLGFKRTYTFWGENIQVGPGAWRSV